MLRELFGAFRGGIMQGKVVSVLSKKFGLSVTHPLHLEKIKELIIGDPEHNEFEHAVGFLAALATTFSKANESERAKVKKYIGIAYELYAEGLARKKLPALMLNRNVRDALGIEVEVPPRWWLERGEIPLARCSALMDIAGPDFGDDLRATFTVRTEDFIGWLLLRNEQLEGRTVDEEATLQGVLFWARRFEEDNYENVKAPKSVHELLLPLLENILNEAVGFYTCHECDEVGEIIEKSQHNKRKEGEWTRWLDVWKCENGHTIYMKPDGIKLIRGF